MLKKENENSTAVLWRRLPASVGHMSLRAVPVIVFSGVESAVVCFTEEFSVRSDPWLNAWAV